MEKFFPDLSNEQRLRLLQDNCVSSEQTKYYRELTEEELVDKHKLLSKNLIDLSHKEDEFKVVKDAYKADVKPLVEANKKLLTDIKMKKELIDGTLFHLDDQDKGIMTTYDEYGEFISSRRLKPEEKQARLFINKAVND